MIFRSANVDDKPQKKKYRLVKKVYGSNEVEYEIHEKFLFFWKIYTDQHYIYIYDDLDHATADFKKLEAAHAKKKLISTDEIFL